MHKEQLTEINKLLRTWILTMTTEAGSGHPTSSLSAVELMSTLFFGGGNGASDAFFRFDKDDIDYFANDRLIFSKGHASPLFYALWACADGIEADELHTLRKIDSRLEGHPTVRFPFTEAATGSLGQGLSIGLGTALAQKKLDGSTARTWVLLGDSEMAEGQVWEAMAVACHYEVNNLIAVVDVNRLGQRGETMLGHHVDVYAERARAFGWNALIVDGHDVDAIIQAYGEAIHEQKRPTMIIAQTIKGKGVSFIEDKNGWHGKALNREELATALAEIGNVDFQLRGRLVLPDKTQKRTLRQTDTAKQPTAMPSVGMKHAPRNGYGEGLCDLMSVDARVVVLDAEVSNSTRADFVKKAYPDRFFEMYIAEQNMASVALGMARRGYKPYLSTFAAFFSRCDDQVRMAQFSDVDLVCVGTHPGVSIGADGASQMGLADVAFFRALLGSSVVAPADAVSTRLLTQTLSASSGISYLRVIREEVSTLYDAHEQFPLGGSKTLLQSAQDDVAIIASGIVVHEAMRAAKDLKEQGVSVRVIDAYSLKPFDSAMLYNVVKQIGKVVIVEDHYAEGGLGAIIKDILSGTSYELRHLCVRDVPRSGHMQELLAYEKIDAHAITQAVQEMVQ